VRQSEFAEIVCRAVRAHHTAVCGSSGGAVPCAPGVVPRGMQQQPETLTPAKEARRAA
jgi:hypothetical protein